MTLSGIEEFLNKKKKMFSDGSPQMILRVD